MTDTTPAEPDPNESPDLDAGGSPETAQPPAEESTSLDSDSARTGQSPAPFYARPGVYLSIAVVVLIALLMVIGTVFGVF